MLELSVPEDLPEALRAAWATGDAPGLDALHRARTGGSARERVRVLLALASLHLRQGDGGLAQRWADEALAVTRSQRLARDLRGEALLAVSVATRLRGSFQQAEALAESAMQAAGTVGLQAAALLAQATARRLSGDGWGSLMAMHAAQERRDTAEGRVAGALAWLALDPVATVDQAAGLAGQVSGTLRARLAWLLAEQALRDGRAPEAQRWIQETRGSPFAQEEARQCLNAAALAGLVVQAPTPVQGVQVLTLERQGLLTADRFIPVPGDGRLLALLAFLTDAGPTHWERAAEAVLDSGPRAALYGQVRHHLSVARSLLGHPGAVTSRRGIVNLATDLQWSCDALDPAARSARPWLPHLSGWWVQERRAHLARP